jgi:hypothetical protein
MSRYCLPTEWILNRRPILSAPWAPSAVAIVLAQGFVGPSARSRHNARMTASPTRFNANHGRPRPTPGRRRSKINLPDLAVAGCRLPRAWDRSDAGQVPGCGPTRAGHRRRQGTDDRRVDRTATATDAVTPGCRDGAARRVGAGSCSPVPEFCRQVRVRVRSSRAIALAAWRACLAANPICEGLGTKPMKRRPSAAGRLPVVLGQARSSSTSR